MVIGVVVVVVSSCSQPQNDLPLEDRGERSQPWAFERGRRREVQGRRGGGGGGGRGEHVQEGGGGGDEARLGQAHVLFWVGEWVGE